MSQQSQRPPERPPSSSLSRMSVLPPIPSTPQDVGRPPTPTGMEPNTITDDNVDMFLRKKEHLVRHIMGAPDLLENAEKYEPLCRKLSYGTLKRINPIAKNRTRLGSLFIDCGYFEFLIKYWKSLQFNDPQQWPQIVKNSNLVNRCVNFVHMLGPQWNGTDNGNFDYLKKFDEVLRPFYLELLSNSFYCTFFNYEVQTRLLRAMLGTLHNIVHKYPNGSSHVRDSDGVTIIGRYVAHKDLSTKTKAIMVLSYIVNESEQNKLVVTEEHITYIMNVLKDCIKGVEPRHYSRTYGYVVEEVLEGLNRMAVADANKATIVRCGALPLYAQLMQDGCSEKEQSEACRGLWILAFNDQNKKLILQQADCMQGLRKLSSSSEDSVRRAAQGALWAISEEDRRVQQSLDASLAKTTITTDSTLRPTAQHIMISYNWGIQSEIIKIKDRLKAAGYKIWIDVEQMSGSTLDAMAAAIENASLVLIFFTESYKTSPNCRSEAEYCYKVQKPFIPIRMQQKYIADGWLGIFLGSKLFYDFTRADRWESTFESLCKEIDKITHTIREVSAAVVSQTVQQRRTDTLDHSPTLSSTPTCSSWNEGEVQEWLRKHDLHSICPKLSGFTGVQVGEMQQALLSAPSYFYNVLDQKLGMSLKDTMTFAKMLRDLK